MLGFAAWDGSGEGRRSDASEERSGRLCQSPFSSPACRGLWRRRKRRASTTRPAAPRLAGPRISSTSSIALRTGGVRATGWRCVRSSGTGRRISTTATGGSSTTGCWTPSNGPIPATWWWIARGCRRSTVRWRRSAPKTSSAGTGNCSKRRRLGSTWSARRDRAGHRSSCPAGPPISTSGTGWAAGPSGSSCNGCRRCR